MRRVTLKRPTTEQRSRRLREERASGAENAAHRSEIRRDVRRAWWPEDC